MTNGLESPAANGAARRIKIDGVGPIQSFAIDLSGHGVYVLRGSKGLGKSTAISCVELLAGQKVNLTLNDRCLDGRVSGFGTTVPITRQRIGRPKGEFEGFALDSEKYTLADITDPDIQDPAKADAHRIRALASLARVQVRPEDFYELVGGRAQFEAMIKQADLATDDPVLITSRVKSAFDYAARQQESLADRSEGQAQACIASVKGIDLDADCDPAALALAVEAAVQARAQIKSLAEAAERAAKMKAESLVKLNKARASYTGPSVARAEAMHESANNDVADSIRRVEELRQQLQLAESERDKANARRQSAIAALTAARHQAELIEQLESIIARDDVQAPSPLEIAAADETLNAARLAAEEGVRVRDGRKRVQEADQHRHEAELARANSENLRKAAASTFGVLMRAVKLDGVRIRNVRDVPRLVVDHPRRGETLFGELSDGERVLTTIRLLMPLIGDCDGNPGVFPISQRLFQDLPDSDIAAIDAYAREHGLFVFGAHVDDGKLRVEKWGE